MTLLPESPVWLLDVDGVVNAVTKKPDRNVWPLDTWISGKASDGRLEWPILAARPVLDFIRDVHKAGRAEIRWHTTWQEHAAHIADLLDLPDFSVHPAPEYATYLTAQTDDWWKIPGALRVVEDEGRALLWTDDDADNDYDLPRDVRRRITSAQPTLIVAPSPYTGLCRRHLRQIDEFLTDCAERDVSHTPAREAGPGAQPEEIR